MTKPNNNYSIGVDIGGTKMSAILFDGENVIADYVLATPKDDLEHFMIMLKALIEPLQEKAKADGNIVKGVGLGVAGMLNLKENKIVEAPNLPLLNRFKLPESLAAKIDVEKIKLDNDVNCFLRAEMKFGAGKKRVNVFGIAIGTGIGGAWWHNNEIYQGAHDSAMEAGWLTVDFKQGMGLEQAYHKLMQNSPAALADEAYRGDVLAQKFYDEFGHYLGISLANVVNLIDPELIIVGGGVVESSDLFLSCTKKIMKQYIKSPEAKVIKIVKGKLGANAGAIGAALLAL
ncbi:ROK family protein [Patescibacteria group bacterium]|nr:ROK family protein [Patescibacteria group bacterium]MBU1663746.1 ROK family protein [Patescibacteria group bacterium]